MDREIIDAEYNITPSTKSLRRKNHFTDVIGAERKYIVNSEGVLQEKRYVIVSNWRLHHYLLAILYSVFTLSMLSRSAQVGDPFGFMAALIGMPTLFILLVIIFDKKRIEVW